MNKKNPRTQFEIHSMNGHNLMPIYDWCLKHLPLKEEKGLIYQVTEIYIITSSQRIIDKVNKGLGTDFTFNFLPEKRVYYTD